MTTAAELGQRELTAYTIHFRRARAVGEAVLRAVTPTAADDGTPLLRTDLVDDADGDPFVLEWYAQEPDSAVPAIDPEARPRAVRALATKIQEANAGRTRIRARHTARGSRHPRRRAPVPFTPPTRQSARGRARRAGRLRPDGRRPHALVAARGRRRGALTRRVAARASLVTRPGAAVPEVTLPAARAADHRGMVSARSGLPPPIRSSASGARSTRRCSCCSSPPSGSAGARDGLAMARADPRHDHGGRRPPLVRATPAPRVARPGPGWGRSGRRPAGRCGSSATAARRREQVHAVDADRRRAHEALARRLLLGRRSRPRRSAPSSPRAERNCAQRRRVRRAPVPVRAARPAI